MTASIDNTSRDALYSLNSRLRRLEFLLAGTCEDPVGELQALETSGREHSIAMRLSTLERELSRVVSKSQALKDILELHELFPDLFKQSTTGVPQNDLGTADKAVSVLASAPEYQSINSQLTSVMDHPVPATGPLTSLIELFPRIQQAQLVQEAQAGQVAQLRTRTLTILEKWYFAGVDGVNECFAEWDERIFLVDKKLRQREHGHEDVEVAA